MHNQGPNVIFLLVTKKTSSQMDALRLKLGFQNCFAVNRRGLSGGLAILWDDLVSMSVRSYSHFHINPMIVKELGREWRFTGFYGNPIAEERHHSWTLLRRLSGMYVGPWLCVGDFNEIVEQSEKNEGAE